MVFVELGFAALSAVMVTYYVATGALHFKGTMDNWTGSSSVYTRVEGVIDGGFSTLDCNANKTLFNNMMVGIQDRPYWYYLALKDTDHAKCAKFSELEGLSLQYTQRLAIISSRDVWNSCPSNSVLVSIFDQPSHGTYFEVPEFFSCGEVSAGFTVDTAQCEELKFQSPFELYQSDLPANQM